MTATEELTVHKIHLALSEDDLGVTEVELVGPQREVSVWVSPEQAIELANRPPGEKVTVTYTTSGATLAMFDKEAANRGGGQPPS